ncbi:MAG TPA: hypothetical protein VFV97_09860 [Rhodanobacteraceae bacterium]|nr:hypothetical protein [Rhodanobacteraceae bacterium]
MKNVIRSSIFAIAAAFAISLAIAQDDDDDAPKKAQNAAPATKPVAAKADDDDAPKKAASPAKSAAADDDDDAQKNAQGTIPTLNKEQRNAVGIAVARAVKAKPAERVAAFGQVLDPSALIGDLGELDANRAAERAASAEVARLQGLYKAGASASLKNLETAQADQAHAHAQAEAASSRFALRWAPVAALPAARRQKLIENVGAGRSALVRVDLPGQQSLGSVPESATLEIDGVTVNGRVLGALMQASESQSASVLAEIEAPPTGLAIGARIPAYVNWNARAGWLVPRGALIYEEGGAFVYHQLNAKPGDDKTQYARKKVTLLMQSGEGWLVDGLDDDDLVVVHGAGVLWSLEGVGAIPEDDDD